MTLHQTIIQYQVYLKAHRLPDKRMKVYQQALADVERFYGPETPMEDFDNSVVLDYVAVNDPFEVDPVKVKRGVVFCKFTHWLMMNHLIPAWEDEVKKIEKEQACSYTRRDDIQVDNNLFF